MEIRQVWRRAEEKCKKHSQSLMQGAMDLRVMGRRQVTPRRENDPLWRHSGGNGNRNGSKGRGGGRYPLLPPGRKTGGGRKRAEQFKKSSLSKN